jgi:hypothetical protein
MVAAIDSEGRPTHRSSGRHTSINQSSIVQEPVIGLCDRLIIPIPSDGPTLEAIEPRPPVSAKKVGMVHMENTLQQTKSGQQIDGYVGYSCSVKTEAHTVLDRLKAVPSGSWRTLRHWTTDDLVFRGKPTTAFEKGDGGLADAWRLNLIASRLRSLAGGAGAL